MKASISSLDFSDRHEVIGYGRVAFSERGLEKRIEVLLRPADGKRVRIKSSDVPESRWIGCGQLDKVTIGSIWRDDKIDGHASPAKVIFGGLSLVKVTAFDSILEPRAHGSPMRFGDIPCFQVYLFKPDGRIRTVYIPILEFARAVFGVSSHFLVQMFSGIRVPSLASDSAFFDRDASRWRLVPPRTFRIVCARPPTDLEALMAACVLTDAGLREAHDSVFRNLQAVSDTGVEVSLPKMSFPFEKKTLPFELEGSFVDASNGTHFLVSRLRRLAVVPNFSRLEIKIIPPQRLAEGLATGARQSVGSLGSSRLQTSQVPGSSQAPVEEVTDGAQIEPAGDVEIIYLDRQPGGGPGALALSSDQRGEFGERLFSTDDRLQGGAVGVAHLKLRRTKVSLLDADAGTPEREKSLQATFDAIAGHPGWFLLRGSRKADGSPLLDPAVGERRSFLILLMVVRCSAGVFAVADAGTTADDNRALGLIARVDHRYFDQSDVDTILAFAADNRAHWRDKSIHGFKIRAVVRHPSTLADGKRYRDLIASGVERLFTSSPT